MTTEIDTEWHTLTCDDIVFAMKILVNQMVAVLVSAILCYELQPTGVTPIGNATAGNGGCIFCFCLIFPFPFALFF